MGRVLVHTVAPEFDVGTVAPVAPDDWLVSDNVQLQGADGAYVNPDVTPLDPIDANLQLQDFLFDYYYRIWVIPAVMQVNNPRTNIDIPFQIWNAYPYPNTLQSITGTGLDGLELDVAEGDPFRSVELRTVNLQIKPSAPLTIDALFIFGFDMGEGTFEFTATRAYIVEGVPEVPIVEVWAWLTDVIASDDNTEQRIALRDSPRRRFTETLTFDTAEAVRDQLATMYGQYGGVVLVPLYQYQTRIKQPVTIGDTAIYINVDRTEVRAGAYVFIAGKDGAQLAKVSSVETDHIVLEEPAQYDYGTKTIVMPLVPGLMQTGTSFRRSAPNQSGIVELSVQESEPMLPFLRSTNTQTLTEFDGLPILERRPIGTEFDDTFDTGLELIDYETGNIGTRNSWAFGQIQGTRQFLCQRIWEPNDWDYWKVFLDYCRGKANPFLICSNRPDIVLATPPVADGATMVFAGSTYSTVYSANDAFKRVAIITAAGTHLAKILSVTSGDDGDTVTFTPAFPNAEGWDDIQEVSFMLKCRLSSDEVTLTHQALETTIALGIRTVEN